MHVFPEILKLFQGFHKAKKLRNVSIDSDKCCKKYIGETSRNLNKIIYDYRRNVFRDNTLIVLIVLCNKSDYNFYLKNAFLIIRKSNLRQKCIRSELISEYFQFIQHITFLNETSAIKMWNV